MFSHLTDFGHKRNPLAALGFYVCYFGFILIVGFVIGAGIQNFMPQYSYYEASLVTKGFASLICLALSLLIIQSKGLNTNIPLLLLSLCSGILAFHASFLGLIIPTFLSMIGTSSSASRKAAPKKKSRKK